MPCPHCQSPLIQEQAQRTSLGYWIFRYAACTRRSDERTGMPFNYLNALTDHRSAAHRNGCRERLSCPVLHGHILELGSSLMHGIGASLATPSMPGTPLGGQPLPLFRIFMHPRYGHLCAHEGYPIDRAGCSRCQWGGRMSRAATVIPA